MRGHMNVKCKYLSDWSHLVKRVHPVSKPVWHTPLLCVQWRTDNGQRNCPKHVEFHSKNKSEKLVHPVGLIIRNKGNACFEWETDLYHIRCNWHKFSNMSAVNKVRVLEFLMPYTFMFYNRIYTAFFRTDSA